MRRIRVPLLMFVLASLVGSAVQVTWSAFSTTTANPSNSFSAASSFVTCLASSPLWLSGMEHGASSISGAGVFTSGDVGTAATVDSTVARTGSYSLKIVKSNGSSGKVNRSDTSGLTDVTVRFAVRFQTLPAATVSEIFSFTLNTAGNLIFGYNQGTGKFTMKFSGAAGASSVNTVNAGQ